MSDIKERKKSVRSGKIRHYIGLLTILILLCFYIPLVIIFFMIFGDHITGIFRILYIVCVAVFWIILLLPVISWLDRGNKSRRSLLKNKKQIALETNDIKE